MATQTIGGGSTTSFGYASSPDDLFITGLLTSRTTADNHPVAMVRLK